MCTFASQEIGGHIVQAANHCVIFCPGPFFRVQSTFELFVPVDVMFFAKMEWKSQRDLLPSVNSISAVGWSLTVRSNYLVINEPPITSANGRQMAIGGSS